VLYLVVDRVDSALRSRILAFDANTLANLWWRDLEALPTRPVADTLGRLYVATQDCEVLVFTPEGDLERRTALRGEPTPSSMRLDDGRLFVATELAAAIPEEGIYPGSFSVTREDGGMSRYEDYDCGDLGPLSCVPPFYPDRAKLYVVEALVVPGP
jgi:outer membrane protein assembly factor BamB